MCDNTWDLVKDKPQSNSSSTIAENDVRFESHFS